jgi:hypothetical protein
MQSRLLYLIGGGILCLSTGAWSQMRPIPENAQRGWLKHVQEAVIAIDDKPIRMAPGGIIRNEQNLIVVPASLPSGGALAEFQIDASGQVTRAWLLSPQEAAREKPRR